MTNHGSKATPNRAGLGLAYPTWAVLRANGDSLAQAVWTNSIGLDRRAEFRFELGRKLLPGPVLFSVAVNPHQIFVELTTDDNTDHILVAQP